MDKLFFLSRLKAACFKDLSLHLFLQGSAKWTPYFRKEFFIRKQKTAETPLFTGEFRLKKYFEFF